jgi:hypothetical protein
MIGSVQPITIAGGVPANLYLLRFGKDGRLQSPQTAHMALKAAERATDVFFCSHGWNNIYADAIGRCRGFAEGFIQQRASLGLSTPADYRPLLIGMIWPATWFVLPWEEGPDIAGGGATDTQEKEMLAEVTDTMLPEDAEKLADLLDRSRLLLEDEARQVAEIIRAQLWPDDDPDGDSRPPDTDALLSSWRALSEEDTSFIDEEEATGTIDSPTGGAAEEPDEMPIAAGGLDFDPRDILRMGSVWKMKARAGAVGAYGVGPLLAKVLKETEARVHLVGHSFGARVMLSAIVSQSLTRNVHSILLLQPAVNRWCFAQDVASTGRTGGTTPCSTTWTSQSSRRSRKRTSRCTSSSTSPCAATRSVRSTPRPSATPTATAPSAATGRQGSGISPTRKMSMPLPMPTT